MWRRSELKDRAKWVLKNCYWKAVLVSLIVTVISGGLSGSGSGVRIHNMMTGDSHHSTMLVNGGYYGISPIMGMGMILGILSVVGIGLAIFFFSPLEVNARRFFIISRVQPADLNELGFCFKNSYMNVVKVQFLRSLFTFLWSLLLIIPGIVKAYEYRMIPYILAEDPGIDYRDAFRISKDMMAGQKWDAFVLDLSFFGWYLLSAFTCGLLALFYVNPYVFLTNVELYDALKCRLFGSEEGNPDNGGHE